jgi:hypothetical protein
MGEVHEVFAGIGVVGCDCDCDCERRRSVAVLSTTAYLRALDDLSIDCGRVRDHRCIRGQESLGVGKYLQ